MKVQVLEKSGFLYIKPGCLSVLSSPLTYRKCSFEYSMKQRKRVMTYTDTSVYKYDDKRDMLLVPAGVKSRVLECLRKANYQVEFKRVVATPKSRRKMYFDSIDFKTLRTEQKELLNEIVSHSHTTCKAPTGAGKSFLISYICRMYKKANIVITTDSKDVVATLKSYLNDAVGEPVGQVGGGKNSQERVTVSTLKSLHKVITKPDILIIDECHVIATDTYVTACLLASSNAFKVIGMSASPEARSDNATLVIESICGPLRTNIGYQTSVKNGSVAQIEVDVYECNQGVDRDTVEELKVTIQTEKDRLCLWTNTYRNNLIRAIIKKELKANPDSQILIYTERTEHALMLYNKLNSLGFKLVHGKVTPETIKEWKTKGILKDASVLCTDKDRAEMLTKFETAEEKLAICTRVWQKGVSFEKLNLLIRADAMPTEITADQACGRLSRTDGGEKLIARVIDFNDTFNKTYAYRYQTREKIYKNHGWKINYKTL